MMLFDSFSQVLPRHESIGLVTSAARVFHRSYGATVTLKRFRALRPEVLLPQVWQRHVPPPSRL